MLDQRLIRENPTFVEEKLSRRGNLVEISHLHELTLEIKKTDNFLSELQSESRKISKHIGNFFKNPKQFPIENLSDFKESGNKLKLKITELEEKKRLLKNQIKDEILILPNIPSDNTPFGKNESSNIEIKRWGTPKQIDRLKSHWEIGENLNLYDSKRTSKISKARFITLIGYGSKLERALINFMLDTHSAKGYMELMPPALVNSNSLIGSGQLPKFSSESFNCANDDLWLSPTAEVPLTAFHKDEIIDSKNLPLKYVAYSPCFRREAGSYGKDTKGLIRLHQFNKVELYWYSEANKSLQAHNQITADAEDILQKLNLPYRVVDICTGDLGFSSSRTFDLEVWLPSSNAYREISSCSNCLDFQARRSSIRTKINNKTSFIHTLNASGLAIGRTMAAILENCQQIDGSVKIPEVLVPYFGSSFIKAL